MGGQYNIFAGFALIQIFTCFVFLLPHVKKNKSIRFFSALLFFAFVYHIPPTFLSLDGTLSGELLIIASANVLTALFYLTGISVFTANQKVEKPHYFAASVTVVLPYLYIFLMLLMNKVNVDKHPLFLSLHYLRILSELALVTHIIYIALSNLKNDLMQQRRNARVISALVVALYFFSVIVLEQLVGIESKILQNYHYALLGLIALGANFTLFTLKTDTPLHAPTSLNLPAQAKKAHSPLVKRIINAMEGDKIYREEGITISSLSKELSIQEYKLRRLINGELAYKNFNDFLNDYRVKEVAKRLSDSDNSDIPILTLALDAGFRSLSSFNKAFKNAYGKTPTEYRQEHLS